MSLAECRILQLNKVTDHRGSLTFVEKMPAIDFSFERIYYLYDLDQTESRGHHAHKKLKQLVVALNGSFNIELDDGSTRKDFRLDSASEALYICPMIWRRLYNFSPQSICMVIASLRYDESDYIRSYEEFKKEACRLL